MAKIYLVQTPNRTLPLDDNLIQIKGKSDGTMAICLGEVSCEFCVEKTLEEVQFILDQWIDEENVDPPNDELGDPIIQRKINMTRVMETVI